jgi:hypothetical protein
VNTLRARRVEASGEHEYEPVHGLPDDLPAGEHLLWQGTPDWRRLAIEAFHLRKLAIYFAALLVWRVSNALLDGGGAAGALASLVWPLPLALTGLALVAAVAWLSARTTVYTLTNRRVVMRLGIVLTITFNLPLRRIESAALQRGSNGSGDISLLIAEPQRIAYLHLWPHARAWHVKRTQPMLRALSDVQAPARLLADALQASLAAAAAGQPSLPTQAAGGSAPAAPGQLHAGQTRGPGARLPLAA